MSSPVAHSFKTDHTTINEQTEVEKEKEVELEMEIEIETDVGQIFNSAQLLRFALTDMWISVEGFVEPTMTSSV